jgi:PAS domain S-box-containing protein
MTADQSQPFDAAELRRRAEVHLKTTGPEADYSRSDDETRRLLHELQVHQIELEMQNVELRQARDELETALGKYTDLYDFAPVGYFTLDREGIIRAVNLRGASLLGIERSRLLGRRLEPIVTVADRPGFTAFLRTVFESQAKAACELALLKEDEGPLFVQIEAVAVASGQECLAAILDISERRRMEETLEIMRSDLAAHAADLEAANAELEAFNYTVTHDLRIPLTTVHGYCQALKVCGNRLDEQCRDSSMKRSKAPCA